MPLIYRDKGTSGTQIEVLSQDLPVAHIGKVMFSQLAGGGAQWRWYFKMQSGQPGFARDGQADTFEDAKAAVEQHWAAWLAAAGAAARRSTARS